MGPLPGQTGPSQAERLATLSEQALGAGAQFKLPVDQEQDIMRAKQRSGTIPEVGICI